MNKRVIEVKAQYNAAGSAVSVEVQANETRNSGGGMNLSNNLVVTTRLPREHTNIYNDHHNQAVRETIIRAINQAFDELVPDTTTTDDDDVPF